jgi:hypothetical protein
VNLDEYRQFRHYQDKKNQDFERLDRIAALNAEHVHSLGLTEEDVLALIEQAREEVYQEHIQSCSES